MTSHRSRTRMASIAVLLISGSLTACVEPAEPAEPAEPEAPTSPRERIEQPLSNTLAPGSSILAEVEAPGGSVVAFVREPDGELGVLEHGMPGSSPISSLAQLAAATPYEVFRAIAPAGLEAPAELAAAHERARSAGYRDTVPEGFRVEAVPSKLRYFSSCTDIEAWKDEDNGLSSSNCKGIGNCLTNKTAQFFGCLPGGGCYPTGWNQRMRWSTCNLGTGTYEARLVKFPGEGTYSEVLEVETSTAGAYYYYARHTPGDDNKWSMSAWSIDGAPKGHFSLWADL